MKSFGTFTETLICDLVAAVRKLTNSFVKSHLLSKVEVDGLQGIESFETFIEVVQTLICDSVAAVSKSTNSSVKSRLRFEVEIDGL